MKKLCAALALCFACHAQAAPGFAEVQRDFKSSDAVLLDRNGELLHQLRLNPNERRLSWIELADVSPAMRNALIASEDKRFYEHSGVDWTAVGAAAWANLWHTKTRGASTLTMQLAGLLDEDLKRRSAPRSAAQKLAQAVTAKSLERNWRKDQILEAYLNLVSFRGEVVGVHALSRVLFGKHPSGLDRREAAIAVALIRGPNAKPAKVAERACAILKEQNALQECQGLAGQTELALARSGGKLEVAGSIPAPQLAPHLARKLLKNAGQPVRSTVDAGVQRFARDAVVRHLSALVERNIEDGAVVVLDNASGDVLAWVGSSGELSSASEVDGVLASRQAGSTLKPFLYELAIERKWLTAASVLDDSALNLPTASGLYIPQNYDKQFKGLVSVRTSLGSSLNIPAVRTLVMVTPERFFRRLQALGFHLRESGDYYGYSLALGSADVSLLSLANAYRALANQGRFGAVRTRADELRPANAPVMDAAASYIVADILADRSARAVTFGLDNVLNTRMRTAAKTGTSKDMRDNWCIGFSERFTVGVWVGNASGAPMWNVSGVTGAAPIWQEVMHYLHKRWPALSAQVTPPKGVVAQAIRYAGGLEAARTEYFLAGTEQTEIHAVRSSDARVGIAYPTPGMLVALDPDIPPKRQRIRVSAHSAGQGSLTLDGKLLARAKGAATHLEADWMPWPGKHVLALLDAKGAVVDEVKFEVRGAREISSASLARPTKKKAYE